MRISQEHESVSACFLAVRTCSCAYVRVELIVIDG